MTSKSTHNNLKWEGPFHSITEPGARPWAPCYNVRGCDAKSTEGQGRIGRVLGSCAFFCPLGPTVTDLREPQLVSRGVEVGGEKEPQCWGGVASGGLGHPGQRHKEDHTVPGPGSQSVWSAWESASRRYSNAFPPEALWPVKAGTRVPCVIN